MFGKLLELKKAPIIQSLATYDVIKTPLTSTTMYFLLMID